MLLDATTKIDGGPQEDQGLSGLESPLESLSVYDRKGELSELESAISKVSLQESDEHASDNEEAETEGKDQTSLSEVVNATTKEKKSESVPDIHSDRTDDVASDSSEKDDAGYESETEKEKDNDEEDSLTSEKKEKKSLDETKTNDADRDIEDATERKEKKGDKESEEEDTKKSTEKKKTTDNGTAEEPAPSGKKLLPRGLGAGTLSSDQQYPYPLQGFDFLLADAPNVPSGPFTQAMSPQYAMSPTYMGMAVSPMSGYNESSVHSPLNGMSNVDGMSGINLSPYMIPESPNSMQDENEFVQLSPQMPDSPILSSHFHSTDDVLEAIAKVENNPNTPVPTLAQLLPIRRRLEESLEGFMHPDVNQDVNNATYLENQNLQNSSNDFFNFRPTEPTPPMTDFDLSRREAELEIHQCLDRQLFDKASKKMAKISNEELTKKDTEGDTPCMVVACQQEDSDRFRENLCAMVNRAKTIRMCCEYPINNRTPIKMCMICGKSDEQMFYSPFAMVNNEGDTLLSSILKVGHSQQVVNFICETIFQNPADINRIFSQEKIEFYQFFKQSYPVLGVFLPDY
ncbi:histone-lysine N-methyltransferase SETD1B-like isoform X2 [Macrobrachium nipponense]|uniref:histone-lysine N-methyltransferase SETD1B-like isoform X2 n=1 Tax=Macrobrachium nipponense TaxID=159736 RepID=UPI0030C88F2F